MLLPSVVALLKNIMEKNWRPENRIASGSYAKQILNRAALPGKLLQDERKMIIKVSKCLLYTGMDFGR
jgi:hypothetical protein